MFCVHPQSPGGHMQQDSACLGKAEEEKLAELSNQGAQIGAEATTSHGRRSCLALAQRLSCPWGATEQEAPPPSQALGACVYVCVGGMGWGGHGPAPVCYQDGTVAHYIFRRNPVRI